jgi:hypothetical protein
MMTTAAVTLQWDTLQAYCKSIGLPGLEIELAAEHADRTRGKAKVVENVNG